MPQNRLTQFGLAAAVLIGSLSSVPFRSAEAASFDCRAAGLAADEAAICQNIALNDMDVRMVTTFELLREILPMGSRGELESAQVTWLEQRRACGANLDCLAAAYASRMAELRNSVGEVLGLIEGAPPTKQVN
jgi:uncharacterized protein